MNTSTAQRSPLGTAFGTARPSPLSVAPLEAREPVPAPAFPPAADAAFERSRRAAALVRRAGLLRQPRALAQRLVEAGLVAEGERGGDEEEEDEVDDDVDGREKTSPPPSSSSSNRRSLLAWRDDLAAGLGSRGWLSLWEALSDAGCSLDVEGVWVHASDCPEAEEEELREKGRLLAAAHAQAESQAQAVDEQQRGKRGGEENPPPAPPFPSSSRAPRASSSASSRPTPSAPTAG